MTMHCGEELNSVVALFQVVAVSGADFIGDEIVYCLW